MNGESVKIEECPKAAVPWKIFIWVIGIIFLVFSISAAAINSIVSESREKTEKNSTDIVDIKVFMGKADTTFQNIDKTLIRLEEVIKNQK